MSKILNELGHFSLGGSTDETVDQYIFRWFNDRMPDEMYACLRAYDAAFVGATGREVGA